LTNPNSGPPLVQVVEVVCCRPSDLQRNLYEHFLRSNAAQRLLRAAEGQGKAKASALTAINALRKLCGHPRLIYDVLHPATGNAPAEADGFKVLAILEALQHGPHRAAACQQAPGKIHGGLLHSIRPARVSIAELWHGIMLRTLAAGLWAVLSTRDV
jgi:hypothetical protein